MTQVSMHRLRWWDIAEVARLEGELFGTDAWSPAQFWSELARVPESRWYVVARVPERIVGYAGLFLAPPEADVQTLAVAGDVQGRGIGRGLLTALTSAARSRGVTSLRLEVRADNAPALALYTATGFESDGRRRGYYGPGQDAVLMTRRLREEQGDG